MAGEIQCRQVESNACGKEEAEVPIHDDGFLHLLMLRRKREKIFKSLWLIL